MIWVIHFYDHNNAWHKVGCLNLVLNCVVCPLEFDDPSSVVKACDKASSSRPACCAALHTYIATRQKQIFVTNLQAINCATMFGSMLQKAGVGNDIYQLCDIDLKDFSLQGMYRRYQNLSCWNAE
jgi:hypothetical protein